MFGKPFSQIKLKAILVAHSSNIGIIIMLPSVIWTFPTLVETMHLWRDNFPFSISDVTF